MKRMYGFAFILLFILGMAVLAGCGSCSESYVEIVL